MQAVRCGTNHPVTLCFNKFYKIPRIGLVWGLMLGGELAVLQAPMFDGLAFDPFALFDDG